MDGMWVKRLGRTHNCLEDSREVLTKAVAAETGEGSMWMCGCGAFWVVMDDGDGIHRWRKHPGVNVPDGMPFDDLIQT